MTKPFSRFATRAGVSEQALCRCVSDAEKGLIGADLGGGVIKQRIARSGQGKSGGFRTLIVFRASIRSIFVYGFAKSERENITREELTALKKLAARLLAYDDKTLLDVTDAGELIEVSCAEKALS